MPLAGFMRKDYLFQIKCDCSIRVSATDWFIRVTWTTGTGGSMHGHSSYSYQLIGQKYKI